MNNNKSLDDARVKALRADTPGCHQRIHLNNAGAALMPTDVFNAIRTHLELELRIGGYEAARRRAEMVDQFYDQLAKLLRCQRSEVGFVSSSTDGFAKIMTSIPWSTNDVIITTEEDYVSNQLAFLELVRRYQVRLIRTPRHERGGVDLEAFKELVEKEDPKLVAVTHVPTNSGLVQPIEEIGKICKDHGCWYVVDACQSVGQMPLDVQRIGCDFLTGSFRKFLRGPRGTGFIYVSTRALQAGLVPMFVDLQGASWSHPDRYEVQSTANRFEYWERPHAMLHGARVAIEYALQIGLGNIEKRVQHLANMLRKDLRKIKGVRVLDQGAKLCGIVSVGLPGWEPDQLIHTLEQEGINASVTYYEDARLDMARKDSAWTLRLSPHYYNSEEEMQRTVTVIRKLVQNPPNPKKEEKVPQQQSKQAPKKSNPPATQEEE